MLQVASRESELLNTGLNLQERCALDAFQWSASSLMKGKDNSNPYISIHRLATWLRVSSYGSAV